MWELNIIDDDDDEDIDIDKNCKKKENKRI